MKVLTVVIPFRDYAKGDVIPQGEETDRVLSGHEMQFVVASEGEPPADRE